MLNDPEQLRATMAPFHTHTHTHTDMQAMLNDPEQLRATMTPFLEMMGGDKGQFEEMLQNPAELQNKMKGE